MKIRKAVDIIHALILQLIKSFYLRFDAYCNNENSLISENRSVAGLTPYF